MADIDRTNRDGLGSRRTGDAETRSATGKKAEPHIEHHLRGAEFDADFADADEDSCTSTRRRNDRESDS